ncbi:PotD/PotF family extracellular solute-binding protein [Haloferax sp. Atlit-12N]|uniref:ABC transporter substrate-binding protein n=1 Tax=Haloferax sp. Atlit-12N TaxID=2077203 RepID=UPI0011E5BF7F|nr:extracellular solute-binding protein [Haloferax sp. Atlit-12N]
MSNVSNLLSRRSALKYGAAAGASLLAGCSGNTEQSTEATSIRAIESVPPASTEGQVNVWNWYVDWMDWAVKEFEQSYDASVSTAMYSTPNKWYTKLEAGNNGIDSISATSGWVVRAMNNDFLQPLPVNKMDGWDGLSEMAKDDAQKHYQDEDNNTYAIPEAQVAHPLVYNTEFFDEDPGSWEVLWESDLKGKIAMQDWGEVACRVAALYTGQDPNDPDDFKDIEEALIQQKELNHTYWQDHSSAFRMFKNEEIVATVYTDVRAHMGRFMEGMPIDMSHTKEGFMYTYDTFVIPDGAPNPKAALAWTDMFSKPENAAKKVTTMGCLAPVKDIGEHIDISEDRLEFIQWPNKMSDSATFIEPMSAELRQKFDEIWTRVKAA